MTFLRRSFPRLNLYFFFAEIGVADLIFIEIGFFGGYEIVDYLYRRDVEQKNIFKKFSRAGRWATRDVQGTGLGLYISKSLTEVMGGKIWVDSEVDKGATFFISLSEVRQGDEREISGDVVKLGEPEQKEAIEKGKVKHSKLKPESQSDDTSRRMREVLKEVSEKELKRLRDR